ncbi:hypothetical protein BU14_0269s0004 [Porphyra umbilicalis]|uniref:Peptidase M13 C-terminal domain-containing protein n=1 Tax=Porphyra umbilicalis TaxID=2786 RepID=A0A1X6P1H9_PORUM|nr:hypothetical protein BU14_0269s0004 [Porphyra umbilicalis]|eukprot:OSX74724.1 hypothetical protein BU14_0269s0004 [Porphyra umbilicalis]
MASLFPPTPPTIRGTPTNAAEMAAAVLNDMDRSARPCTDFYRYACGGYLDANLLPPGRPFISRADDPSVEATDAFFKSAFTPGGQLWRTRAGDWFSACAAAVRSEPTGNPLRWLARLLAPVPSTSPAGGVTNETVVAAIGRLHASGTGGDPLWGFGGLPVTAQRLADGGAPVAAAHRWLVKQMVRAACRGGVLPRCRCAGRLAATVTAAMRVEASLRNATAAGGGSAAVPIGAVPLLGTYLAALPLTVPSGTVFLSNIGFWAALGGLFEDPSWVADVPAYLAYAVTLDAARNELLGPAAYASWTAFEAVAADLDAPTPPPTTGRERCLQRLTLLLPDDLAPPYVRRFVTAAATAQMGTLYTDVQAAVRALLRTTPWLDAPSTAEALAKIDATTFHNGAEPVYDAYTDVVVRRGRRWYGANVASASASLWRRRVAPLTSAAAARRWGIPPFVADASNRPAGNIITMNAATAQWPGLPPDAPHVPAALVYGAAGTIIGHEFGHSLDSTGLTVDAAGAARPWLTNASRDAAAARAACVVAQYDGYRITELGSPPVFERGAFTLDENIADTVGVAAGLAALRGALGGHAASRRVAVANPALASVFTDEQLYFVSTAQGWCAKGTRAAVRAAVAGDVHALNRLRVLGPLSQSPAFAAAFDCPAGSVYRPKGDRCKLFGE